MDVPLCTGVAFVKQVISGDTIVLRGQPKNSAPPEKTVVLTGIIAPKLGRKKKDSEEKDEPYAWEAREFLRERLIGKEVYFSSKPFPNATGSNDRELGKIYYPTKEDDITEELVANGLAKVKKERVSGKQAQDPDVKKLVELEEKAASEALGVWSNDKDKHIRPTKYPKDYSKLVTEFKKQPVNAIVESVRLGPYMIILDVTLLPSYYHIPLAVSGAKFNNDSDNYRDETKFVTERRILQQSGVQVVIEKAMNTYAVGSVIHPKGDIAESLLSDGYMCCDDRTIITVHGGAAKLRAAEKLAREKRYRIWKDVEISVVAKTAKREFQAVVTEIINGEAMIVKVANTGKHEKIFLSSIRSPKIETKKQDVDEGNLKENNKENKRPTIFDVPYLFEAREFLRKKLIGKKVTVTVDYVQPAREKLPEKNCCTVMVGTTNVAEALVTNGLATVFKHREKDDRSSHYDTLCAAEVKATEGQKGLHSKGEPPKHRFNDLSGNKAVGLFPMLQKADRILAIVEYVSSGTRMRLCLPKDSLLITFLLSGISCPRASSKSPKGPPQSSEPFGDEALSFTKEKVLQREVEIRIENIDKKGGMVGTLTVNNVNLALALIEAGLAEIHSSCSDGALIQAEKVAKESKIGIWENRQEDQQKPIVEEDAPERKVNYKDVCVSVVSPELHLFAHHTDERKTLNELTEKLQEVFSSNPPTSYSKDNPPPKGRICAAKFLEDNQWYRGKVEKTQGGATCKALIYFIDYGNRQYVSFEDLAPLPDSVQSSKPFAHEYSLACVNMPPENYYDDVAMELLREIGDRTLRMNIEYFDHNLAFITLVDPETNENCNKALIEKGLFYVQRRREKKLQALIKEYDEAEAKAKKERRLIWEYGDARADDAKEFGLNK